MGNICPLNRLPVSQRGHSIVSIEGIGKSPGIRKAIVQGNAQDGQIRIYQGLVGVVDAYAREIFFERGVHIGFKCPGKMLLGK